MNNFQKIKSLFLNANRKVQLCIVVAFVIFMAIVLAYVFSGSGKTIIRVESALKEMVLSSDLSTMEHQYNSITQIENEKEIECYISYKGKVKLGFDFEDISVKEHKNTIYVVIPEINVTSVSVDEKSIDFLFLKDKYKKEGYYEQVNSACYNDLLTETSQEESLKNLAVESAVETMNALTEPLRKTLDEGVQLKVIYIDDFNKEVKR